MTRRNLLSITMLTLGLAVIPLLGQQSDDQPERRDKKRGFIPQTRFIGITNIYEHNLTGLQLGIATNVVYGNLMGLQVAGAANVAEGDMTGLQGAFLANVTGRTVKGGQISMLANVAGKDAGIQMTGLANVAGGGAALQAAGLANVAADEFTWAQLSGLANVAAGGSGFQVSGLANVTAGSNAYIQATGLANVAEGDAIVQVAGLVNVSGESAWGQVGLINITPKARLLQVGLLNISAKNTGLPIGVLNIVGDNPLRFSVTVDGYDQATTAIRSGNKHVYSVAGFQGGRDISAERLGNLLLGLGLNLPLNRAYLSVEYLYNQRINSWDQREGTVGLRAGFRLTYKLALVAGASLRVSDVTSGNAGEGIAQGWSIGFEWFRPLDFDGLDFDL